MIAREPRGCAITGFKGRGGFSEDALITVTRLKVKGAKNLKQPLDLGTWRSLMS